MIYLKGNEYVFRGTPTQFVAVALTFSERIIDLNMGFTLPSEYTDSDREGFRYHRFAMPLPNIPLTVIHFTAPFNDAKIIAQSLPDGSSMLVSTLPPLEGSSQLYSNLLIDVAKRQKPNYRKNAEDAHELWRLFLIEMKRQGWIDSPLPPYQQAVEKYSGTDAKMRKLRQIREESIEEGNVTISRTEACKQADKLSPKTAKKANPTLWANWNDPTYR